MIAFVNALCIFITVVSVGVLQKGFQWTLLEIIPIRKQNIPIVYLWAFEVSILL